jgi:hypothetical protein
VDHFAGILGEKQDFMDAVDAAQESGADISSSSVLNVAPITHESLYPGSKKAFKESGTVYGSQAYQDYKDKQRALMGLKPGEKFDSEDWIGAFGGMSPSQINKATEGEGNKSYYLDDDLSVGMNKYTQDIKSILGGISVPLTGSNKYGINFGNQPSVRSLNPMDINSPYPSQPKSMDVGLEAMSTLTQNQAANQAAMQSGIAYPAGTGGLSLLEAAGYKYNTPSGIAPFKIGSKPGTGGWYSSQLDEIVLPSVTASTTSQKTRHELMHRLVNEMKKAGDLSQISVPQMQEIIAKFDKQKAKELKEAGKTPTALDFMNFVSLEDDNIRFRAGMPTRTLLDDDTYSMGWDPRMRTAGWAPHWGTNEAGQGLYETEVPPDAPFLTGGSVTPWEGSGSVPVGLGQSGPRKEYEYTKASSGVGKAEWDSWVRFQRELPSEKMGGAVAGYDTNTLYGSKTVPWGPATVSYKIDPITGEEIPVSTGSQAPLPGIRQETGLANWPMGSEHALVAAQAARYPSLGQRDPYGKLARFNRRAALIAHPDSRVRAIHEIDLPDIVLDKMQDYLMDSGLMWNEDMTYEGAMDYLSRMLSGDDMRQVRSMIETGGSPKGE